jgi:NitT/TauT family transport system permease protein
MANIRSVGGLYLGLRAMVVRARWLVPILPVLALVGVWWFLADIVVQRPRVVAPPQDVAYELYLLAIGESPLGSSYEHFLATAYRLGVAFGLSFIVGSLLGVLAGRSKFIFDLIDNIVWIFMTVPTIIWVFIFAVALGIGDTVPILAISVLLTSLVLITVAEGAKTIPTELLEMADAYNIRGLRRLREIHLPYLMSYLVGAARVSLATGVQIVIVAEVIGLSAGIGYLVGYWRESVQMAPITAWGVVLITLGLLADNLVFVPLERRVNRWRGGHTRTIVDRAAV